MHRQRYVIISRNVLMRISVRYFYVAHLGVQYEIYSVYFPYELRCQSGICISYNTGKSALPDIYSRCPRASAYISGKARVPVL